MHASTWWQSDHNWYAICRSHEMNWILYCVFIVCNCRHCIRIGFWSQIQFPFGYSMCANARSEVSSIYFRPRFHSVWVKQQFIDLIFFSNAVPMKMRVNVFKNIFFQDEMKSADDLCSNWMRSIRFQIASAWISIYCLPGSYEDADEHPARTQCRFDD